MAFDFGSQFMSSFLNAKKQAQEDEQFKQKMAFEQRQFDLTNLFRQQQFAEQREDRTLREKELRARSYSTINIPETHPYVKAGIIKPGQQELPNTLVDDYLRASVPKEEKPEERELGTKTIMGKNFIEWGYESNGKKTVTKLQPISGEGSSGEKEDKSLPKIASEVSQMEKMIKTYDNYAANDKELITPSGVVSKKDWTTNYLSQAKKALLKQKLNPDPKNPKSVVRNLWDLASEGVSGFDKYSPEQKRQALNLALDNLDEERGFTEGQRKALEMYIEGVIR